MHVDYALMVLVAFYQGMRFSEIASVRRRDLNLPSRTLPASPTPPNTAKSARFRSSARCPRH